MDPVLLAPPFLPATLTSKIKGRGAVMGAEGLWTRYKTTPCYLASQQPLLPSIQKMISLSVCMCGYRLDKGERRKPMVVRRLKTHPCCRQREIGMNLDVLQRCPAMCITYFSNTLGQRLGCD